MAVVLKCPECRKKFRWLVDSEDKWPDACPLCGVKMGHDVPDDVIMMPSLRSAKTKVIDSSYRELEASSEHRMYQAAEAAGCSPSEMAGLKITDIKTGVKPGESYVPEIRNSVTEQMEMIKARGGQAGFTGTTGAEYSTAVQTGPAPNTGAKMRTALQSMHAARTGGAGVSERPALETLQPGYRRRG